ncbi:Tyrosine--tRNA ligase, cytoplasmic [Fusarium oxysporum]|uniref:Tyrosine--tRNA ligase n=1 Tax=Fusarium oxysporum TaxID=5507 RepID=A0A420MFI4_FUSOX|nr:Tyrosine--tRNA ligase, cytoplasmic [Fusarium oxysporum]
MATQIPRKTLNDDEKYTLITSNLHEVIRGDIIRDILPIRPPKIYWGTATTGRPHAAYFLPAIKIAQFLRAGCRVKILLADLHGFLDADKAPEGVLEYRAQYYQRTISALLRSVGVDLENLEFVRGSSYQLSSAFSRDLLKLSKKVSVHDAVKASSEIVKSMGEPVMADGIYPMMQLLDEEYLDVDAEFGGLDQRKTFGLAHDIMAKAGFKVRAHLMNPMVPGLAGGKMSSSDPKSKIDLIDDATTIRKKIAKAHCVPCVAEGNGVLAFIQHVLLPYSELQSPDGKPSISVILKNETQPTTFGSFAEVVAAYESDSLTPQLAKKIVEDGLIKLTESIRCDFEADKDWQEIARAAYPEPKTKMAKGGSKQTNAKHPGQNKNITVPVSE